MSDCAPIVVIAYNRPEHLRNTLTSLSLCDGFHDSPVLVFFDGPRDKRDEGAVEETRRIARSMLGTKAEYFYADENQGLANSVISAVNFAVDRFGEAIVVEDDLKLHPDFLAFMNRGLREYQDRENVWQISGYMFDVPEVRSEQRCLFLPLTVSWGWATWRRAWKLFDLNADGWETLKSDRKMRKRFNFGNAYDYASMLERQMEGLRDSWAIRWYWSVFCAGGLVLFPPVSYVDNTGFDGSGTHGKGRFGGFSKNQLANSSLTVKYPTEAQSSARQIKLVRDGIWRQSGGWIGRIIALGRRVLRR